MRRWLVRLALAIAGGLSSYIGLSVLLFVATMHRASLSQESRHWQPFPPLEAHDRLLIVAPHPDDEVLGCGGLIATATAQRIPVKVVYLTAGDGFTAAAALTTRSAPDARDCLELGQLRLQEAHNALQQLAQNPETGVCLGYPDRGLLAMALRPNRVYRSPATQATTVPYSNAQTPGAPYIAPALIADLRRVIAAFQPTRVFTTHPLDDHEDHTAAALFTREAIEQALAAGELAQKPTLYYYIVHRGDWPLPQGEHPNRPLTPPFGLLRETWLTLPLSRTAQERKRVALEAHESQYALMARFLSSFVRQNELFAPASPPRAYSTQPYDDNPAIHLQPRADIVSVQAQAGREGVRVSIETLKPFRAPYQMEITLLTVDSAGNWSDTRWRYPNARLAARREGNTVHLWLPHRPLGTAERAYLMVSVRLYGAELDRTGLMPIPLSAVSDAPTPPSTLQYAPSPTH
ncbi:MAG: hypothetical protein KatS3mg016_1868 [Fimbriimonadales bacterium]|nr:MAG: hypothetical protein KatS3mg016_1868 [Fimbriimonadales bacterium]